MICINYDHNKKFGLLKFHSNYDIIYLNSPKGYSLKIINTQTDTSRSAYKLDMTFHETSKSIILMLKNEHHLVGVIRS